MGFFEPFVSAVLFLYVECQIIFVQLFFRIIIILPDKASLFPVFRNDRLSQNLFIFINGIQVKKDDPIRVQIVMGQAENLKQILFLCNIVQGITGADNRPDCAVQFEFTHILQEIKNIVSRFSLFFIGQLQHLL